MASIRYLVQDVDDSIKFYVDALGFSLVEQYGPAMAIVEKDDLTLWLAGPASSAAKAMPDGSKPVPGGWNRLVIRAENLAELVGHLKTQGISFRNEIVSGPGGSQILCVDPSGNLVELFQSK